MRYRKELLLLDELVYPLKLEKFEHRRGKTITMRRKIREALAKRARSGPFIQKILDNPLFSEAINELRCKDLDVEEFYSEVKRIKE